MCFSVVHDECIRSSFSADLGVVALLLTFVVNPANMIFHVVHAGEDAAAFLPFRPSPFALDAWIVLGFVPSAVLFAGEPAGQRLVC
jgi:hypothetical protein